MLLLIGLSVWPVSYRITRLAIVLLVAGVVIGLALLVRSRIARTLLIGLSVVSLVLLVLPGRTADARELRSVYVSELLRFDATPYVWGGENRFGIDCSGLVRRAFIWGNCKHGVRTANPKLLRDAIALWWFDASAQAMRDEYRNRTIRLFEAADIATVDHSRILPGDLALTTNGVHALAYLGEQTWIEADPRSKKVVKLRANDTNSWLNTPVWIVRWRQLESTEPSASN